MFDIPTRFGMAPAQVKALMDSTGGLWQKGAVSPAKTHARARPGRNTLAQRRRHTHTLFARLILCAVYGSAAL